jgi:HSP20 family molecular chaperone IbpA
MTSGHASHQEVLDATAATQAAMKPQVVPVNMYETSGALVVVAPIPAVMPSDVTVELNPPRLRFWASLRSAGTREFLLKEWDYGGYEREIDLPAGYGSGMEASVANGQLVVRILRGDPAGPLTVQPHATPTDRA